MKPMFDDHPFACLCFVKTLSIDFVWELKSAEYFVLSDLASQCFVNGYQVDTLERSVQ